MKKPRNLWLSRQVAAAGPYLALALNSEDLGRINRHLGVSAAWDFGRARGGACTWAFENNNVGRLACVVCVSYRAMEATIPILASTVAHEATHVWQFHAKDLGETTPGDEQEAYAIEWITRTLLEEVGRRTVKFTALLCPDDAKRVG